MLAAEDSPGMRRDVFAAWARQLPLNVSAESSKLNCLLTRAALGSRAPPAGGDRREPSEAEEEKEGRSQNPRLAGAGAGGRGRGQVRTRKGNSAGKGWDPDLHLTLSSLDCHLERYGARSHPNPLGLFEQRAAFPSDFPGSAVSTAERVIASFKGICVSFIYRCERT